MVGGGGERQGKPLRPVIYGSAIPGVVQATAHVLVLGGGGHFEGPQPSFQIVIKFEHMTRVVLIGYPVYRYSFNLSGWGPPTYPPPHQLLWNGILKEEKEKERGGLGEGWRHQLSKVYFSLNNLDPFPCMGSGAYLRWVV